MKNYDKAASCYKKACELDPDNQGYKRNYQITLSNLQKVSGSPPQSPNEPITATTNLMETAARIMTDNPEVSSVYVLIFNILQPTRDQYCYSNKTRLILCIPHVMRHDYGT